jgi:hypothetical protein
MFDLYIALFLWASEQLSGLSTPTVHRLGRYGSLVVLFAVLGTLGGCDISPQPLGLSAKQVGSSHTFDSKGIGPSGSKPVEVSPIENWFKSGNNQKITLRLAQDLLANAVDPFLIKLPVPPSAMPPAPPSEAKPGALPGDSGKSAGIGASAAGNGGAGTGLEDLPVPDPVTLSGISYSPLPGKAMAIVSVNGSTQYLHVGDLFSNGLEMMKLTRITRDGVDVMSMGGSGLKTHLSIANIIGYQPSGTNGAGAGGGNGTPGSGSSNGASSSSGRPNTPTRQGVNEAIDQLLNKELEELDDLPSKAAQ